MSKNKACKEDALVIGEKYGRLTVIGFGIKTSKSGRKRKCALCRCNCGNQKLMDITSIKKGLTVSCGCYNRQRVHETHSKGNHTKTPLYYVWTNMKQRCQNSRNPEYHNYGGRGIKVCDEWQTFQPFHEWAVNSGYTVGGKDQSIDRINVNGNYEPSNCRWATFKEQQNNRRVSRKFNVFGVEMSLEQMAKLSGIHIASLRSRIYSKKMRPEEAISIRPKNNRNEKRKNKILTEKVKRFRIIANEMTDTYESKQHDYNDSFGISVRKYGNIAALTRMSDKFNRIENLILNGNTQVKNESLLDSLKDLACYCVMTVMAIENNDFENVE